MARLLAELSSIRPEPLHLQVEDEMRARQHPEDERLEGQHPEDERLAGHPDLLISAGAAANFGLLHADCHGRLNLRGLKREVYLLLSTIVLLVFC